MFKYDYSESGWASTNRDRADFGEVGTRSTACREKRKSVLCRCFDLDPGPDGGMEEDGE